jgi:hypothetical protein
MGRHQATKRLTGGALRLHKSLDKLNGSKILRFYSSLIHQAGSEFFRYIFLIL